MTYRYWYVNKGERVTFGQDLQEAVFDLGPLTYTTKQAFDKISYHALTLGRKVIRIARAKSWEAKELKRLPDTEYSPDTDYGE